MRNRTVINMYYKHSLRDFTIWPEPISNYCFSLVEICQSQRELTSNCWTYSSFPSFKVLVRRNLLYRQLQAIVNMTDHQSGRIQLIVGPMFSGKSSELLRRVRRYEHASKMCLVVSHLKDNMLQPDSYIGTSDSAKHATIKCSELEAQLSKMMLREVVAIDEGQFFPEIVEVSEKLANAGKIVIVAALDSTFERKPFGRICEMIPLAETVDKLTAVCYSCQKDAAFTLRISDCKQIKLLGQQSYRPVCRKCHIIK